MLDYLKFLTGVTKTKKSMDQQTKMTLVRKASILGLKKADARNFATEFDKYVETS